MNDPLPTSTLHGGDPSARKMREGLDIEIAARAAMTCSKYARGKSTLLTQGPSGSPNSHRKSFSSMVKRMLKPLKPMVLPLLSRLRTYFNQPLVEHIARLESQLLQQSTPLPNGVERVTAQFERRNTHLEINGRFERTDLNEAVIQQIARLEDQLRNQSEPLSVELARMKNQLDRVEQYALAAARRVAVSCGPSEVLIRTEVGFVLCSASDPAVIAGLLETGELEPGTRHLIQRFLRPGNVFIDVGANLGMQTLAAAHAMQGRGRIIAFEPFEPTQRLLSKSIWINGFSKLVEIHQAAVSDRNGYQPLYLGGTSGHHSLFEMASPSATVPTTVEVPLVRLDSVVPESLRINLIKIDVEGAELAVLESAKSLIAANPSIALIVEFGHSHLLRTGQTTEDWLNAFRSLGLDYRAIHGQSGELEEWTEEQLESVDSVNLFFARQTSTAWFRAGVPNAE